MKESSSISHLNSISTEATSRALFQNNIGALMLLKRNLMQEENDEDQQTSILLEATHRFYASLVLHEKEQESLQIERCSLSSIPDLSIDLDDSKVNVDLPGLVWFHNRLWKSLTYNHHSHNNNSINHNHLHSNAKKLSSLLDTLMTTQIPLGLEYYMHPFIIQDVKDVKLAAGMNLALSLLLLSSKDSIMYHDSLQILLWVLHLWTKQDKGPYNNNQESQDNPILRAMAHNNLGVLRYMQQKSNSAAQNFFKALDLISLHGFPTHMQKTESMTTLSTTLPMHYIYITIQLNCTRAVIEIKHDKCAEYVQALVENVLPTVQNYSVLQYHHPTHAAERVMFHWYKHYRIKWIMAQCKYYIPGLLYQYEEHYHLSLEKFNDILSITRKEWGHDHIYVATILEKKGMVSFEERRYHSAMLSYFASLRIYERHEGYELEQSRLWYAIGRTLHDREEFSDALGMYRKALSVRKGMKKDAKSHLFRNNSGNDSKRSTTVETIQIWTNICRVCYILGDLEEAMNANERIIEMAIDMMKSSNVWKDDGTTPMAIERHAFVRNRMMVLGNLYVEMGRVEEAMEVFTRVARVNMDDDWHMWTSHGRPEVEDVDTNAFATKAAERLGSVVKLPPHAAAA
jgi:tetratricopeptide (TPR) repeat protein